MNNKTNQTTTTPQKMNDRTVILAPEKHRLEFKDDAIAKKMRSVLSTGGVVFLSYQPKTRGRRGKDRYFVELCKCVTQSSDGSSRRAPRLQRDFAAHKKRAAEQHGAKKQWDEVCREYMQKQAEHYLRQLDAIQKYSGGNARICLLRLLDAPDDNVRRPLLGDLIVSWVPGLSGRMSMTDRQLTSVGISNKLVAYLSRMRITANYTSRPSTTCSIDQSIGAALEYNSVFHKLFQKGIVHKAVPPTEKWVPPTNTHKLLAQSKAKAMLSRKQQKQEDRQRGPLPACGVLAMEDEWMCRALSRELDHGCVLGFTFFKNSQGEGFHYEVLGNRESRTLAKKYSSWKKSLPQKEMRNDPKLFQDRVDAEMMVDVCVPRYQAALQTLAQSSAKQSRVFVARMMGRPATVFETPKFGDLVVSWSPLRDTNEFSHEQRVQSSAMVVKNLCDFLNRKKVVGGTTVRRDAAEIKDDSLRYSNVYHKLFGEQPRFIQPQH